MSDNPNIRLNKVLRELNIATDTAVQLLENHGHMIAPRPTAVITHEQYQILSTYYKGFKPKKRVSLNFQPEKKKFITTHLNPQDGTTNKPKRENVNKPKPSRKQSANSREVIKKEPSKKLTAKELQTQKDGAKAKKKAKRDKIFFTKKRPEAEKLL